MVATWHDCYIIDCGAVWRHSHRPGGDMRNVKKRLILETTASSCYFRTSVPEGSRKALVQITERCNLHCAHCFVSSTKEGSDITLEQMRDLVIPRLIEANVIRVTLTGGEPFAHPDLLEICQL